MVMFRRSNRALSFYATRALIDCRCAVQPSSVPCRPVESPPWKILAGGRGANLHSAVATPDNQTLITLSVERNPFMLTIARYDIQQKQWLPSASELSTGDMVAAMRAVMDPQTEAVYINGADSLNVYNSRSDTLRSALYPPRAFPSRSFAGGVYNSARKTVMYLGGYSPNFLYENTTYISEYATASQTWSIFVSAWWASYVFELCPLVWLTSLMVQPFCLLGNTRRKTIT